MQTKPNRIYAFDHLRTSMMLLILVFHSALTYIVTDLGVVWPIKDPNGTSILFDGLIAFINCVSMPVFFVMSGFMTSSLFVECGVRGMIRNRVNRIFLPFAVFLLILFPITGIAFFNLKLTISNSPDPFFSALSQFYDNQFEWRRFRPIHLWFLYYLILFCVGGGILASLFGGRLPRVSQKMDIVFSSRYFMKLAPLILAAVSFILLYFRKQNTIETPGLFSINFLVFFSYALFFAFGWILYFQKNYLTRFRDRYIYLLAIGSCFFIIKLAILSNSKWVAFKSMQVVLAAIHALIMWYLIFGLIGLALKYFNKHSLIGRYLNDASYWIYLVHFPIVFFLQAALIPVDVSVYIKFLLVVTLTFLLSILSYHYLVYQRFIGKFLNGK